MSDMVERALAVFGLVHLAAYAAIGLSALLILAFNVTAKRLGIGRIIIQMYWRHLQERRAADQRRSSTGGRNG